MNNRKTGTFIWMFLVVLANAGKIDLQVMLDSTAATDVTSWFFQLKLETPLQINSHLVIDFSKDAQIRVPDELRQCQAVRGFSENPACIVVSET